MAEQLMQFDAKVLKERVTESVRAQFGMLIPEDEWNKLVEREVHAFFNESAEMTVVEKKVQGDSWHSRTDRIELVAKVSPFRALVWEALHGIVKSKCSEALNDASLLAMVETSPDMRSAGLLGEVLQRKLEELAPKMVAQMFSGIFAHFAMQVKDDILSAIPRPPGSY